MTPHQQLESFCLEAINELNLSKNKTDTFFKLRYREMSTKFPHKTFSVMQSNMSFFEETLDYIRGKPFPPKPEKDKDGKQWEWDEYVVNYINWLKKYSLDK
jgi:hypothetical protein